MILADPDLLIDYLSGIAPMMSTIGDYAGLESVQITAETVFGNLSPCFAYCRLIGMPRSDRRAG